MIDVVAKYEEDFHLIPTCELEILHEDDGVYVRHVVTDVWHKDLYRLEEDKLDTVKRTISNLTYQVYLHRLEEKKNTDAAEEVVEANDVLTNLVKRVEKIEHAMRMR